MNNIDLIRKSIEEKVNIREKIGFDDNDSRTENIAVSVIVPICNVEAYLDECLKSITSQSLENIEIICIDDGSTDSSLEIIKKFHKNDPRIKIISKDNSGYGHTMNLGIMLSTGKYIGIVESDDYIAKDMFETLYNEAEKNMVEVIKSDHYLVSAKVDKPLYQWICPEEYYDRILNYKNTPKIFSFVMMNWAGIYSREFLLKNSILHNETPGASFQDNGFWFQVMSKVNRMMFIHKAFYYYRQDNPNSSINNTKKMYCMCDEYKYIYEFLVNNFSDTDDNELFTNWFEKKVHNYLLNYKRLDASLKLSFLEHISQEFSADLKNPRIHKKNIDAWVLSQVNRIIDSPSLYLYEDEVYVTKEQDRKVKEVLDMVRNSKEFRTGLQIKKLLHLKI